MKKNVIFKVFCCIFLILTMFLSSYQVFADPYNQSIMNDINMNITGKDHYNDLNNFRKNVISVVILTFQFLSIAAIVYAGVKYMYAGAQKRAELKKGLLALAIGSLIVFGGLTIVRYTSQIFKDVTGP